MTLIQQPEIIRANGAIFGKYIGDMMKRVSENTFNGHGIRWHDPDRKDLQGEWFSAKTYLMRNAGYPVVGVPTNYQHGLHKDFGNLAIGIVRFADEDEFGLFVEGEKNTYEQYIEMLKEIGRKTDYRWSDKQLAQKSALMTKEVDTLLSSVPMRFSGGFDPSTWIVDSETRHIDQAGMIHLAFTPTPADDLNPIVRFKSALTEVLAYEPTTTYSLPVGATITISTTQNNQPTVSPTVSTGATEAHKAIDGAVADIEAAQPNVQSTDEPPKTGAKQNMAINIKTIKNRYRQAIRQELDAMAQEELAGIVEQIAAEIGADVAPDDVEEIAAEVETEIEAAVEETADEDAMMMVDDEEEDETLRSANVRAIVLKHFYTVAYKVAYKVMGEKKQAAEKIKADAQAKARTEYQKGLPGVSNLPAFTGKFNNGHAPQLSVSDPLKYAHLSPMDMAMAWKIAVAASPFSKTPQGLQGRKATDFVTEEFYRHAMHKMVRQAETATFSRAEDAIAVKSMMPFKANELDATDITGQGLEWLGTVYDTMVWESARNKQIYQLMLSRGMIEKPVPQGMKTVSVPVEGADLSVYGGIEGNSTDATGRPEVVYKIQPQLTSTVDVTPGTFRTATAYTFELGEDSFVDMASEANRKVRVALEEHIEKAMINGDTETGASANINDIAGTPTATGLTRDYFLEFDGLRKSPLVSSTAFSRPGGTLAVNDYRLTWALLGSAQSQKENLFFLIDFNTFQASLDLLPTLTKDVAGETAALFTGEFDALWGIPIYMSGFMGLSNSAGKIDLDTPGNNTKGQIVAVYALYWAFVFKRNITIEMQRSPDSESFEFYGSMRFSLQRRSASASAISYDLTV